MNNFFIGAIPVDLVTGGLLKQGAGGDAQKIAARAQEGIVVINAAEKLLSGDFAGFINGLTAALAGNKTLSVEETLAMQNLMVIGQVPTISEKILSGTMLAQAEIAIATDVLEEARKVCNGFISAAAPATPAAVTAVAA